MYYLKICAINPELSDQAEQIRNARYYNRRIPITRQWFTYAKTWDSDYPLVNLIPYRAPNNFINPGDYNTDYLQLLRILVKTDTVYCCVNYVGDEQWMLKVGPEIIHRHYYKRYGYGNVNTLVASSSAPHSVLNIMYNAFSK